MEIINMTPDGYAVYDAGGNVIRIIPASGRVIRMAMVKEAREPIDGIPTSVAVFGEPVGLPEQADGVFYIVSHLVKFALPQRTDLLVPAEVYWDIGAKAGTMIGCHSLER